MNKKLLSVVVIAAVILIGGYYTYSKIKANHEEFPNPTPQKPISLNYKPFDSSIIFGGEVSPRVFTDKTGKFTVLFKESPGIENQARNSKYELLLNQKKIGEVSGQGIQVNGFSPNNRYFSFRTRSVSGCAGLCQDLNLYVVNLSTEEMTHIPFPRIVENYVKNPKSFSDIMEFISLGGWQNDSNFKVTFYFVGMDKASGVQYRISPKENWNYNLDTKTYTLFETLAE